MTTITDNLNSAVGIQLGGWVTQVQIAWPPFIATDNTVVAAGAQIIAVDNTGEFSTSLVPNSGAQGPAPGITPYYTFTFTVARAPNLQSQFTTVVPTYLFSAAVTVPFSGTPVTWEGCTVIENWPTIGGGGQSLQPGPNGTQIFALPKLQVYASYPAAGANGTLPGPAFDLPENNPPTPNSYGTTIPFGALDFESGLNQAAFLHLTLPPDWVAQPIALTLTWMSSAASGSTTWSAASFGAVSGSTVLTEDVAFNSEVHQTQSNNLTPRTPSITTLANLPITGCRPSSEVWFRIKRTDSSPGTSSLISVAVSLARAL